MKKVKFILPVLAFLFAIVGTFVSQANNSGKALFTAFAQIPDNPSTTGVNEQDCVSGTLNEGECTGGSTQCTITINSVSRLAYLNDTGITCTVGKFYTP